MSPPLQDFIEFDLKYLNKGWKAWLLKIDLGVHSCGSQLVLPHIWFDLFGGCHYVLKMLSVFKYVLLIEAVVSFSFKEKKLSFYLVLTLLVNLSLFLRRVLELKYESVWNCFL